MRLGRFAALLALPLAAAAVACGGSSTAVAPASHPTAPAADSSPHHGHGHGHGHPHSEAPAPAGDSIEKKLDAVAAIHGAAFFLLVAHAGLGLQLREPKLKDRARKRRMHTTTAVLIALMVAIHAVLLIRAG